ncbi:hypothetical protein [Bacillus thuringiensis]|uniref:hypothetical protein n=1 Tax=Bacillus thuringiensis TaxID=1428 RepID=UPI00041AE432|nr:hypothetical protein [Bacillus thuringiensis]EKS8367427.1 hypothetical protein [Bacillus cereus]EKS8368172.1 hypothetical protein [Bacillus cereus]MED3389805.1 hypothetical protein [Bacillus thuringiensis]
MDGSGRRDLNIVLSASKLMKASEVIEKCAEMRQQLAFMFVIELEVKQQLRELNGKS